MPACCVPVCGTHQELGPGPLLLPYGREALQNEPGRLRQPLVLQISLICPQPQSPFL